MDNALRCPPLAHRSAAAHKLHSAQATILQIRESQNHLSGTGLSLFHPGGCPSYRDHRTLPFSPKPMSFRKSEGKLSNWLTIRFDPHSFSY
jgi:hypothetical protein